MAGETADSSQVGCSALPRPDFCVNCSGEFTVYSGEQIQHFRFGPYITGTLHFCQCLVLIGMRHFEVSIKFTHDMSRVDKTIKLNKLLLP